MGLKLNAAERAVVESVTEQEAREYEALVASQLAAWLSRQSAEEREVCAAYERLMYG